MNSQERKTLLLFLLQLKMQNPQVLVQKFLLQADCRILLNRICQEVQCEFNIMLIYLHLVWHLRKVKWSDHSSCVWSGNLVMFKVQIMNNPVSMCTVGWLSVPILAVYWVQESQAILPFFKILYIFAQTFKYSIHFCPFKTFFVLFLNFSEKLCAWLYILE